MHSILPLAFVAASSSGAVPFLIHLVILAVVFALLWYVLSLLPLPAPIKQVFTVIFVIVVALFFIDLLLSLDGGSFILWR
jgi:hypothetical protein